MRMVYYDTERRHSSIGYLPPMTFIRQARVNLENRSLGGMPLWTVPPCGQPAAAHKAWTTLRVAHTAHSPDDGAFRLPSRCQRITISTASSGTAFGGNAPRDLSLYLTITPEQQPSSTYCALAPFQSSSEAEKPRGPLFHHCGQMAALCPSMFQIRQGGARLARDLTSFRS